MHKSLEQQILDVFDEFNQEYSAREMSGVLSRDSGACGGNLSNLAKKGILIKRIDPKDLSKRRCLYKKAPKTPSPKEKIYDIQQAIADDFWNQANPLPPKKI